uniref:Uncharacterized protein n=1 Tax=Amphilophus citrinellus TaxID=61819 RepID=A0A3Q0T2V5_AMPCI
MQHYRISTWDGLQHVGTSRRSQCRPHSRPHFQHQPLTWGSASGAVLPGAPASPKSQFRSWREGGQEEGEERSGCHSAAVAAGNSG